MASRKKSIVYRPSGSKKPLKKRWFLDFILFLILITGGTLFFLKTPYFEIKEIEVESPPRFKEKIIKIASLEKNFFLFPKNKVINKIKKEIPEIQEIVIDRKFPSKLIIKVKERKVFGIFCRAGENYCFLMSEDGIIFKKREKEEAIFFIENRNKKIEIGKEGIEKDKVEKISYLKKELGNFKIDILRVEIFPFEIRVFTNKKFWIFFSYENLESQIKTLIFIFQKEIPEKDRGKLEYIDLRLLENGKKGPVYWK